MLCGFVCNLINTKKQQWMQFLNELDWNEKNIPQGNHPTKFIFIGFSVKQTKRKEKKVQFSWKASKLYCFCVSGTAQWRPPPPQHRPGNCLEAGLQSEEAESRLSLFFVFNLSAFSLKLDAELRNMFTFRPSSATCFLLLLYRFLTMHSSGFGPDTTRGRWEKKKIPSKWPKNLAAPKIGNKKN